jgi:hypothetical protein
MSRKDLTELTDLQRQALECVRGAKVSGESLSAYCRLRRIAVRRVFDALAALRRRGVAGTVVSKRAREKFLAVKIAVPTPPMPSRAAVCRVVLPGGISVECASWPPCEWLESLHDRPVDAAP